MAGAEGLALQDYFARSNKVWFPDFEETLEQREDLYRRIYGKHPAVVSCFTSVLQYLRGELSRPQFAEQFLTHFSEQGEPPRMLSAHRKVYKSAYELCTAYQSRLISNAEFDEQLLLSFRDRPTGDVFSPAFESWDTFKSLISKLEKKSQCLPVYFDGISWNGYLKGNVESRRYAELYLAGGTGDYLCQLLEYGADTVKESLKETYSMEVSVALRLRKLCMDYRDELLSHDDFEAQFLLLAEEFCSNIPE